MLYQYTFIRIFMQRFFYSLYLQCRMVWYGPCVNIHNKNVVEQNHLHNWNNSCVLHFPGSGPGSNSTECWYIPQVWWVQILPKETPLSVVNEKYIISPSLLPTTPKGAKLDCHSPSTPITFPQMKLQNDLTNFFSFQFYWDIIDIEHFISLKHIAWWFVLHTSWNDYHNKFSEHHLL